MVSAYVFGHGQYWKDKQVSIRAQYNIIGFIDNNITGYDDDGIGFLNPDEIDTNGNIPVVIAAGKENFISMANQLVNAGISETRIVFASNFVPGFDEYELVIHNLHGHFCIKKHKVCICVCNKDYYLESTDQYLRLIDELRGKIEIYNAIKTMWKEPVSRSYGLTFGKAIDRHYIEQFISDNAGYIQGDVIEVEDLGYTHKYGTNLGNCKAIHVNGANGCIKANIETGEGIYEAMGDCFICTQTLQYIYNPSESAKNIHKMLKPLGTALITVPFLAQYSIGDRSWKDYWRYTPQCLFECMAETFGESNVETGSFGNIKTVTGFLYGLNEDCFSKEDYNYVDPIYPLIVWAVCHKN